MVFRAGYDPRAKGLRAMSYRTKLLASAAIAAIGVVSAVAVALALWVSNTSASGGRVTAGDLNLVYGEGSWRQVTPGVTQPASGSLADGTDGFVTMPGDVIEIRIPITTTLRGDNLNAKLLVSAGSGADTDIADGVIAASYRVENQAGEQAAPETGEAELGKAVEVRGLVSSNDGVTAQWQVVVTVEVTAEYRWTDAEPMLDLRQWAMGGVNIGLEQVREGPGFVEAGDA